MERIARLVGWQDELPLADFDYYFYTRPGRSAWTSGYITLPLWLLAAVCLAWPVTSFLVRRRRRGRGFEVETKAADDPAADPPDAAGGRG